MASGPVALCGFRFRKSLCKTSFPMSKVAIEGYGVPLIFGMLLESSSVNTLVNCSFKIAALDIGSLYKSPSCFRGAIPLLSHLLVLMKEYSFLGLRSSDTVSLM